MTLPTVAALWIGGNLSYLEQVCLRSFVDHGHRTLLYTYGDVENAPPGVEVLDAEAVYPSSQMVRHKDSGSPALVSDVFRYKLLEKQNVIWIDADVICMRPWQFEQQYVYGWEKKNKLVCGAVLGLPSDSRTLRRLLEFCADEYPIPPWADSAEKARLTEAAAAGTPVHVSELKWGVWGPSALTHFLFETGDIQHALAEKAFYPVSFRDRRDLLSTERNLDAELARDCYGVHLWNRRVSRRIITAEGGYPHPDSFIGRALVRHRIDPRLAPLPDRPPPGSPTRADLGLTVDHALGDRYGPLIANPVNIASPVIHAEKGQIAVGDGLARDPAGSAGGQRIPSDAAIPAAGDAEVIECNGIRIPFDPRIITPKIERPLRSGRYEAGECRALRRVLVPGDRVLELGAGLGLCSTAAALVPGVASVTAIEANPDLIPLIRETHRLNGVAGRVDLRNGVAVAKGGATLPFYIRSDFWASSLEGESRPYERVEQLAGIDLADLMHELRPTVLVCDIEGGELGLFDDLDLSSLRHVVLELHPKVYGTSGMAQIAAVLSSKGLQLAADNVAGSTVQRFDRLEGRVPAAEGSSVPARAYRTWPIRNPRVLVTTCMKDEGPFILEWLAWHRAVGVTDFVVFTNDCSDGTDLILDHLAARGELLHLPNPATAIGSPAFQPIALAYTHLLPVFREADFVISMDVDEFLNIRCGNGRLPDLFDATGPFDAISISELNHGANGRMEFEPGWIRPQFPAHQTEAPGKLKAHRGVKTITRLSPRVARIRNHRPDFLPGLPPRWLDGSGRHTDWFHEDASRNGRDVRGSYKLASLDHYALRSMESFFMKTLRGDVVVANKRVSLRYWRLRNINDVTTSSFNGAVEAAAQDYFARQFASDPKLMTLQNAACDWHRAKIAEIATQPEFVSRREWILANAWGHPATTDAEEETP
ncbi:MAG: glycosyltransferase family 2 protein [Tabrizicola sp.]